MRGKPSNHSTIWGGGHRVEAEILDGADRVDEKQKNIHVSVYIVHHILSVLNSCLTLVTTKKMWERSPHLKKWGPEEAKPPS